MDTEHTPKAASESPLIISGKAARRLRLLQLPGFPQAAASVPRHVRFEQDGSLPAALLPEPVPISDDGTSGPWQQTRDVLSEVAVSLDTMQALKIPSGSMVLVVNAARPKRAAHFARLLALSELGGGSAAHWAPSCGVAYLAPSLAYNLGLGLQLSSMLHSCSSSRDNTSSSSASTSTSTVANASHGGGGGSSRHRDRVLIRRYSFTGLQNQGQQQWHQVPQPGSEAASVPVAVEAHIAVVRTPAAPLLQQTKPRPEPGSTAADAGAEGSEGAAHKGAGADGTGAGSNGKDRSAETSHTAEDAPAAQASDVVVAALQQWLVASCRVVQQGDVLAVPRPPQSIRSSREPGQSGMLPWALPNLCALVQPALGAAVPAAPLELLHFKVVKLVLPQLPPAAAVATGAGCTAAAIDVGSTLVKLAGSCCGGLPVGLSSYLAAAAGGASTRGSSSSSSSSSSSTALLGIHVDAAAAPHPWLPPTGLLLPAWRQVAELLASVLHPAAAGVPLRLAVLLHGPAGSGKQTAVAAAAAAAGCHLVNLSCHDIKAAAGAAERHTFDALQAAFAAAAEYAPVVLLLRQVSVLGDGSSHGGSGSSSAQSYAARLGSVLAACIRAHGSHTSDNCSGGSQLFPAPLVLVTTTASADDLPPALRRCFTHELGLEAPDQAQRQLLLHSSLAGVPRVPDGQQSHVPTDEPSTATANGQVGGSSGSRQGAAAGILESQDLEDAALHTAGLLPRELRSVAADAAAAAALQALPAAAVLDAAAASLRNGVATSCISSRVHQPVTAALTPRHVSAAIEGVRQRTASDMGAPSIPSVHWEDVGGMQDIKRAILDTVELPLKHPELFAGGLRRRSGVLLYGPPGTGKTLLAKAVATECAISFLSVKGPELINMYVGESERQIREARGGREWAEWGLLACAGRTGRSRVFARARRARPCVVFFDELDSLAPARGRGSDSGGVMDRVVSQLLAEIDGVQGGGGGGDVFLIGATNRPDLLDPALLRPGRLDRLLYVGIASDVASRLQVLQALTRRFKLAPGADLAEVARCCADRFTGADLYALCSDAWMTALKRSIAALEQQQAIDGGSSPTASQPASAGGGESEQGAQEVVTVTQADLMAAAQNLQPSLSAEEVAKYERIRDQYNNTNQR
ncbi:Peroxisome biogenesis protein 6 [Chlorella vulgaris]